MILLHLHDPPTHLSTLKFDPLCSRPFERLRRFVNNIHKNKIASSMTHMRRNSSSHRSLRDIHSIPLTQSSHPLHMQDEQDVKVSRKKHKCVFLLSRKQITDRCKSAQAILLNRWIPYRNLQAISSPGSTRLLRGAIGGRHYCTIHSHNHSHGL